VRCARRLGFLSDQQADEADELIETAAPEQSSQDIVIGAGFIDPAEARIIETERKNEDLDGHLVDQFKRASIALEGARNSVIDLAAATTIDIPEKIQ